MSGDTVRIARDALERCCRDVFVACGLREADASVAATVLVEADARGIPSHGVARLWRYVNGLQSGLMRPDAVPGIAVDGPAALVIDAGGAMGAPVSVDCMRRVIGKARTNGGAAFGCVRDSNHFGIAGYYAMMALEHDMLGIAMTNTAALGVPTFGRQVMFGTNPLAFAAPAEAEGAFVLDMSTTCVARGKVEVYDRLGKALPDGWAVDRNGEHAEDARGLLNDMFNRIGGGLLPLGGAGEQFGGHKGYGLAVMVDILCSVLAGAAFGPDLADTEVSSARVSHFFGAIRIDAFRDPAEFRRDMDRMLRQLRDTMPAVGAERVYTAGQKEIEAAVESAELGVLLLRKTWESLRQTAADVGVALPA